MQIRAETAMQRGQWQARKRQQRVGLTESGQARQSHSTLENDVS